MKKYIVSDIEYDTDGKKVDLPTTLEIELPPDITDEDDITDALSDKISEITGFCHFGFSIDSWEEDASTDDCWFDYENK